MPQLSAVTTDASGRLTSWQEGIYKVTVRRDAAGRPIVARAVGPGKALESVFKYSAVGVFTGLVGNFESAMLGTLVAEASRGGAVAVGANTDLLTGGIGIIANGKDAIQQEKAYRAFRLRHFYKALYEGMVFSSAAFTRPANIVRIGVFGDSVGNSKPAYITASLVGALGNGGGFFNTPHVSAGATQTGDVNVGTYSIDGSYFTIPSGGNLQFQSGGGSVSFTKFKLFYVREPGAGAFKISMTPFGGSAADEVGYTNVSAANATTELGIIEITKPFGSYEVNITGLSGTVHVIQGAWENTTAGGVAVYHFDTGGLPLSTAQQTPFGFKTGILNSLGLDLAFMEFKDGPEWAAALASWGTVIAALTKPCDWVFIGTTPELVEVSVGSVDAVANNAITKAYADANGFLYFDGYSPLLNYGLLVAMGWNGDGTHLPMAAHAYLASLLWDFLGFDGLLEIPRGSSVRIDGAVGTRKLELTNNAPLEFSTNGVLNGRVRMSSDVECYSSRGYLFRNFDETTLTAFIACNGGSPTTFPGLAIGPVFNGSNPMFYKMDANSIYVSTGAFNGVPSASLWAKSFLLPTSAQVASGTGSPEGAVTAVVGSLFLRSDGGAGTTLYVKQSGTGNTGWAAK